MRRETEQFEAKKAEIEQLQSANLCGSSKSS